MKIFTKIVNDLIDPDFKISQGGATIRVITQALERLEKKQGTLTQSRIVDYLIHAIYTFRQRGTVWKINHVLGPKSIEKFDSDKVRRYYEDKWLKTAGLSRSSLLNLISDRSSHPQAKYVNMPMEEDTKARMLNSDTGYIICQSSTLGWSPMSKSCSICKFSEKCKIETQRKFPEIYRLRIEFEYGTDK